MSEDPGRTRAATRTTWGGITEEETADYLASPEWAQRQRVYFETLRSTGHEPACQVCGVAMLELGHLDVHHHSYYRVFSTRPRTGHYFSDEPERNLVVLCREHHHQVHQTMSRIVKDAGIGAWGLDEPSTSAQALRMVEKKHRARTPLERLGLIPATPPSARQPSGSRRRRVHTGR